MSNEHLSFSNSDFDQERHDSTKAIATLALDVIEEINRIGHGYPHEERFREQLEYIKTGARLSQLEVVSSAIIEVAKGQKMTNAPFYLLDDAHFETLEKELQTHMSEFYYTNEQACKQSIADGMRAGTDDCLRLLLPEAIVDNNPERQDTYFIGWREDLLEIVDPDFIEDTDEGGFIVFLPTKLLNTYVAHVYPPGNYTLPVEEIRLRPNTTLPSLPR